MKSSTWRTRIKDVLCIGLSASMATMGLPGVAYAQQAATLPPVGSIVVEAIDENGNLVAGASLENNKSMFVRIKAFDRFGNLIPGCQPRVDPIQGVGGDQLRTPEATDKPDVFKVTATERGFGSAELAVSCAHDPSYVHKPTPIAVMRDLTRPAPTTEAPSSPTPGGGGAALAVGLGVAVAVGAAALVAGGIGGGGGSGTSTTSSASSNCPTASCSGGGGFCAVPNNCPCPPGSVTASNCPANFGGTPAGTRHCNCR